MEMLVLVFLLIAYRSAVYFSYIANEVPNNSRKKSSSSRVVYELEMLKYEKCRSHYDIEYQFHNVLANKKTSEVFVVK
jgi:hypothetical protein